MLLEHRWQACGPACLERAARQSADHRHTMSPRRENPPRHRVGSRVQAMSADNPCAGVGPKMFQADLGSNSPTIRLRIRARTPVRAPPRNACGVARRVTGSPEHRPRPWRQLSNGLLDDAVPRVGSRAAGARSKVAVSCSGIAEEYR